MSALISRNRNSCLHVVICQIVCFFLWILSCDGLLCVKSSDSVFLSLSRQIVYFFLWVLSCNGFYVVICQIVYFFLCILSCNGLGHDKFVLVNGWHQYGVAKLVSFGSVPLGGSWKVLDTDSINFVFVGRLGFLCLMETRVSCWLKPAKKCLDFWPAI